MSANTLPKVLCVDDEPSNLQVLKHRLEHHVPDAQNVQAADPAVDLAAGFLGACSIPAIQNHAFITPSIDATPHFATAEGTHMRSQDRLPVFWTMCDAHHLRNDVVGLDDPNRVTHRQVQPRDFIEIDQ